VIDASSEHHLVRFVRTDRDHVGFSTAALLRSGPKEGRGNSLALRMESTGASPPDSCSSLADATLTRNKAFGNSDRIIVLASLTRQFEVERDAH
jgi:hypothetical protein